MASEILELAAPAEVVFDRYLRNKLSMKERESYAGKQDLDKIADESMRLLLEGVQRSINGAYQKQKARISVRGEHPNLHSDYVLANVANAIAFQWEGYAFVGLTMPMLDQIAETCVLLVAADSVIGIFGAAEPTEHQRRQMYTALFAILLQFVACHELGHHFHGHCADGGGSSVLWEEFADCDSNRGGLLAQARELDADGFAVHMLLRNFVTGPPRSKFLELLGTENDTDLPLLASMIVAAGSFFFYHQRDFDVDRLDDLPHPPAAVRMHFVVEEIIAWLTAQRPFSSALVTLERYQEIMGATAEALLSKTSGKPWRNQTEFLLSAAGQEYLRILSHSRSRLRGEMGNKKWDLNS